MKQNHGRPPDGGTLEDRGGSRATGDTLESRASVTPAKKTGRLDEMQARLAELETQNEELRQGRQVLEAMLGKYAELYDFAPMGYFTLDDAGVVLEANQTGIALLGTAHANLVGHRFSIFLAEESRPVFNAFLTALWGSLKKGACEVALWGGPPHVQWVRIHGDAVKTVDGDPRRSRIAVTDITAIKDAEQEALAQRAHMQQAQRLESLGMLAGGIAHDFNNMLMAISGNAGLVLEDLPGDSSARPMVEEIVTVAGRAAELCIQMLAFAGKGRFRMGSLDLSKMAAGMSQMLAVAIPKKTMISCRLYENLPTIRADAVQMRQVLMNLIMNASEAIGDGGGSISISTGVRECSREYLNRVRSTAMLKEGPHVFLEVTDTGCGLKQAAVERMFDPFFTTKSLGRGLGLSVVMGIIHAHAGGIGVQTAPGRGTTITLLFPPAKAAEMAEVTLPGPQARWKGKGVVLVVDDEETVRAVCRRMLQHLGLEVLVAKDGREAVAVFGEHRDRIRCVLLDFAMPHLNGEETFHELRKIDPAVTVILSSGYLVEDVIARFEGLGLAGFIHKPYQIEQLTEVMKKVFAE